MSFVTPQSQPPTERELMENDPLYQQILQQKREEVRRQMELEFAKEQEATLARSQAAMPPTPMQPQHAVPQQFAPAAPSMPPTEDREPAQPTAADLQRQKREEYKRELDAQMKEKELIDGANVKKEVDVQNAF